MISDKKLVTGNGVIKVLQWQRWLMSAIFVINISKHSQPAFSKFIETTLIKFSPFHFYSRERARSGVPNLSRSSFANSSRLRKPDRILSQKNCLETPVTIIENAVLLF